MFEKFKSILADDTTYISFLIIIVAVASFGLGRVSTTLDNKPLNNDNGVEVIEPEDEYLDQLGSKEKNDNWLVASKSGSRYHLLTCPGAAQIKDSNKIFFNSINSAEAAGFTPAANCDF